jgi:SAM-dependent methyltransferase
MPRASTRPPGARAAAQIGSARLRQGAPSGYGAGAGEPVPACHSCGSVRITLVHRSRRTGNEVGRCADCRLVLVTTERDEAELSELYAAPSEYERYLASQRTDSLRERHLRALSRLRAALPDGHRRPRLFAVGAGGGDFLALGRDNGFEVAGNEISAPAIDTCRARHGIDLYEGDLRDLGMSGEFDALTMWCVLAHVADPVALLRDALRLLRPGGVLYFHTPRWCLIDIAGLLATRVTLGRLSQVTDRRINSAHRRLYGEANLARLLDRVGFDVLTLASAVGYSLDTRSYLADLQVPAVLRDPVAASLDYLIRRGWFVQNILDVYARKPAA